ncbi:putative transcriptional regulator [Burkholderiales bacterium JOSHI_001]|nr:putative transcriptional regulator [Burkholderiales bacterium JOSHI_001]
MQSKYCMTDDELDRLLRALADRTRRALIGRLAAQPGATLSALAEGAPCSRQAVSQHLALLEAAGLLHTQWLGREKLHHLDPAPLAALPGPWLDPERFAAAQAALAQARKRPAMAVLPPRADAITRALLQAPPGPPAAARVASLAQAMALQAWLAGTACALTNLGQALKEQGDAGHRRAYAKPADGSFSIVEHLWHLADVEEAGWALRFSRLRDEKRPALAGVDGDLLAVQQRYQQRPWRGALRRFGAQRKRALAALSALLAHGEAALARPARFDGRHVDLGELLAAMQAHDLEHRAALAQLWSTP